MKQTVFIGSWDWDGTDTRKGISVCTCEEGKLTFLTNSFPHIKTASPVIQTTENRIIVTEETKGTPKMRGGHLHHLELKEDMTLKELQDIRTYAVNPSFSCLSKDGSYLLAVHHTSTKDVAVKLRRDETGVHEECIYDDAAIELFAVKDGYIQEPMIDYVSYAPCEGRPSLLHSVYEAPCSNVFIICDKGLDKVYSYRIEEGQLKEISACSTERDSAPRYCVFHPEKPLFYVCNEKKPVVYTFTYDSSGVIACVGKTVIPVEGMAMASDIVITPDGHQIFVLLRICDRIAVLHTDENGMPSYVCDTDADGKNARGAATDENGEYLYVCNTDSDRVTTFRICQSGLSKYSVFLISRPANIFFKK